MNVVRRIVGQVNGSGWLLHLLWTTVLLCGVYWKLHEEVAVMRTQHTLEMQAVDQHITDIFNESKADRLSLHQQQVSLAQADAELRGEMIQLLKRVR